MNTLQLFSDKLAISLSLLCAIHCLFFPVLIVLLPSITALQLNEEAFHVWMLWAVIPTSVYALTIGCKQHQQHRVLMMGLLGILFLLLAVLLSELPLDESWEKPLTLFGAIIIALGHYWNYCFCQHQPDCHCPKHGAEHP